MKGLGLLVLCVAGLVSHGAAGAATCYVNGPDARAADTNPGTEEAPWKTIGRAGRAPELKAGDVVLIQSGVYRESVDITVSGEPGKPITLSAAPGARAVVKGSEMVNGGEGKRLSEDTGVTEPFPNAFKRVWKVKLGEEFFNDPRYPGAYADRARRHLSQVFVSDRQPLQLIGPSPMFAEIGLEVLEPIGKGLSDMLDNSFFFDPSDQTPYVKMGGEPGWSWIEIGVRAFALTVSKVHDVVIRGLECRHNRQVAGMWPMCSVGECERVVVEDCKFEFADFCGLSLGNSRHCVVRRCDMSWNGDTGLGVSATCDCVIEDCTLMCNNYRHFSPGWHAGGMKNIPDNVRTTIRRCEVAYNFNCCGIWFDGASPGHVNSDIRILDNVCHHNDGTAIFHEANGGGGSIAGNLCFGNRGIGIDVQAHIPDPTAQTQKRLWVVNNTVADNVEGIRVVDRGGWQILRDTTVMNNLLLRNSEPGDSGQGAAAELLFWMHADEGDRRADTSNHSDYNVFCAGIPLVLKPATASGTPVPWSSGSSALARTCTPGPYRFPSRARTVDSGFWPVRGWT